ncbi:MAG: hypothetical protein Q4F67_02675 [Propionibacteriaceae bacterium]|nr:hypothetical protein [Propionibacteriaceae bacterium]
MSPSLLYMEDYISRCTPGSPASENAARIGLGHLDHLDGRATLRL